MNRHEKIAGPTQLNIKSREARRLAIELVELTGESITEAVTVALQERLAKERRARRKPGEVAERLMEFGRWYSQFPVKDTRTAEEILGYDENGLPT